MNTELVTVSRIPSSEAEPWILGRHYAKRNCPISYAFGAYRGTVMIGVVTYGMPSSATLRAGIAGEEWEEKILELNRLCCENTRNVASLLVGRSLRMLPKPTIIVSYADMSQGHVGYVYQATNFLYTGLSAKRTDWAIKGMEHLHGQTITDLSYGQENRGEWMRQKYGDAFYLKDRPRKHRYIFLHGNRKQVAAMRAALRYPVEPYPKGDSRKYEINKPIQTQSAFNF